MSSIPYSRYVLQPVTWYSFLIVVGAVSALALASREEKRSGLPRDTILDLALWILPAGIAGARLYYVVFSFDQFRGDLLSVFRIWEGGLAIYGGIIAGLSVLVLFCRRRHISVLILCDILSPGLALAQSIGRWGNWFNMEAYGLPVSDPSLCFFPFAVRIPADGYSWHLATFFYESLWNFLIFTFLLVFRRKYTRRKGDIFFSYLFLYAAGRFVIEELRTDSLYTAGGIRISQFLSILFCLYILTRFWSICGKAFNPLPSLFHTVSSISMLCGLFMLFFSLTGRFPVPCSPDKTFLYLALSSVMMIIGFFILYFSAYIKQEAENADNNM